MIRIISILVTMVFNLFGVPEVEENILEEGQKGDCELLRPFFLEEFGELQRKKITLRKVDYDGKVKFRAVSNEREVDVVFFDEPIRKQAEKLFEERKEVELFCLFYETFWVQNNGSPGRGKNTTLEDGINYIPQGLGWCYDQNIVVYKIKISQDKENIPNKNVDECEVISPMFLSRFGALERKKIILRKVVDHDKAVNFQAVYKKGSVDVLFMRSMVNNSLREDVERLFGERKEIELLCLFYENVWAVDGKPKMGGSATVEDEQYFLKKDVDWHYSQSVCLYEVKPISNLK